MQYIIILGIIVGIIYLIYLLIVKVVAPLAGILAIASVVIGAGYALIVSIISIIKSLKENDDPYVSYVDKYGKKAGIPKDTRRSYFFGPGTHHIKIIAAGAFSNQKDYLESLTDWRQNVTHSVPWFLALWVWIFYIIAWLFTSILGFIWVSVFSVFLYVIVTFGMCLFYVFFSLLWLVDRFVLMIKSVQSRCPNDKQISLIPVFICPKCGTGHRKLTPGSYGIFHRKCGCGYQLPTTFMNGRSKLKAICPFCETELAASDAYQFGIQLIGAASSGKTTFLAAFWHLYLERLTLFKSLSHTKFPDDLFKELDDWYRNGLSSATSQRNANMYSIVHKYKKETPHQLTVYDIAGEAFTDLKIDQQQQQFKYCEGIIFVIDPDAAPGNANETISNFTDEFKGLRGAHSKKLSGIPLAVVISKSDLFEQEIGLKKIQSMAQSAPGNDLEKARNTVCREFLNNHGFGNVVNLIDGAYDNVRYFPASAMGHKAASGQTYQPWGIMEPVMWLLSYTKSTFREIVTCLQTNTYKAHWSIRRIIIKSLIFGLIGFLAGFFIIKNIGIIVSTIADIIGLIQVNWISSLIILGICLICALIIIFAQKRSKVPELRILMAILFNIAFIWTMVYFDPVRSEETHEKLRQLKTILFERRVKEEVVVVQEEPQIPYAYVNTYRLNVRSRPSSEANVVAVLEENDRVEVVEKSGVWWKIKFDNTEGYVVSEYLKE
jgi:GTPase SAR1 family protein